MDTKYAVVNTTAAKLADVLNDVATRGRRVTHLQWVGGRDYVVIHEEDAPTTTQQVIINEAGSVPDHWQNSQQYSLPLPGDATSGIGWNGLKLELYDNKTCRQIHDDGSVTPLSYVWSGSIQDDGESWIIFLDANSRPALFYPKRDVDGGVIGDSIDLRGQYT